jgi:(R,R)-butanediol dehydrogenase/meso-butanediol dehydrogenase/diacetyl reductase
MIEARYAGGGTIVQSDSEDRPPGPGEVRVQVAYTGICGTDLHILHGAMDHRVSIPQVIGHEMSGRIEAVGAQVAGWTPGQPVTVMPLVWCGECPACRAGHHHICHRLTFVGIDSPGSMRNAWNVPVGLLVPLPDDLSLADAALVEPTAVAVHDVRRSGLGIAEHAVVIGGGPVGVLIALVARSTGAEVVVLEIDPYRRAMAEQIGLRTVDPGTDDPRVFVESWTDGAGAAVVFEVSGSASAVTMATDLLAVRGRLVMVAIHGRPREIDLHRFFWRELTMVGARVYTRADFDTAIQLIHSRSIDVGPLVSRIVPLGQAAEAFAALADGGVLKVLIDCRADGQTA